MNTHTLEKSQMQTMEALAQASMRISEAKNSLVKIQEQETDYLVEREKKAIRKIEKVVQDSADILKGAQENYQEVTKILSVVNEVCDFIQEAEGKIEKLCVAFDEKSELWEQQCKKQQEDFDVIKKQLTADRIMIENDKKSIEQTKKILVNQQRKIDDRNAMIERTINRLKANRI